MVGVCLRHARLALAVCLLGSTPVARAAPYWVAYEGDDYPENVGWNRWTGYGGAERWLEDGCLVIDSRASQMIYDYYKISRQIDPEPGELFISEWRIRVVETYGYHEAGLGFAPDGGGTLGLAYHVDRVYSDWEGWSEAIAPGTFHEYRIESSDMEQYSFWIDNVWVRNGAWDLDSSNRSFVGFGDQGNGGGAKSLVEWDYVRFGVVPERSGLTMALMAITCCVGRRR